MTTWQTLKKNASLWQRYFIREKVIKATRKFFDDRQFHEVETPLLIAHPPAESYLEVFETTLLDRFRNGVPAYLSTSPEVSLKKLLVAGIGNCYSVTKSFRNMETHSLLHNPEFTILEWYRVGERYTKIMDDCESLVCALAEKIYGKSSIPYQETIVDLSPPWERLTVAQSFKKWARIELDEFFDMKEARRIALSKGYQVRPDDSWEELFHQIFLNEVEPKLGKGKPTILYEFPSSMAALSKKKSDDPRFAERFEFYIEGLEMGDCYSELTDWKEQEERFNKELDEIRKQGKTVYDYDHDFIAALQEGLPECSGIAVGMDRLIMLLADTKNIADTLFFPGSEMFGQDKE